MSTLNTEGRENAKAHALYALAPTADDANNADLSASQRFEIGGAGTSFVAAATGAFHLLAGDSTVVADTTAPSFDGTIRLVMPDGCTHVAMLRAAAVTTLGCAYKG